MTSRALAFGASLLLFGCSFETASFRLGEQRTDAGIDVVASDAGAPLDAPEVATDDAPLDVVDGGAADDVAPEATACPSGLESCGGACVVLATDPRNCGACGRACATGAGAEAVCVSGTCRVLCAQGAQDCNQQPEDGCEATLATDPAHCGGCGNACPARPNGSPVCDGGRCGVRCAMGYGDCDGDPANGCEADLRSNLESCGACGASCASAPNATAACAAGACGVACAEGYRDCDGNASNGCEVDLRSDLAHCGACGGACAAGQVCADGVCAANCAAEATRCGDACRSLATDPAHCGACDRACPRLAHGQPACAAGVCGLTCDPGYDDCDGDARTGCETSTRTAAAHCGACGNACPARPNAVPTCAAGVCGFQCAMGYGDCDGDASNGCEVDLRASVAHCGSCGAACPARVGATAACSGGVCGIACTSGSADCDGNAANGCEATVASDVANCGACRNACPAPAHASAACAAGRCGLGACAAGFASCDGNAANGCEADLSQDVAHCGACGARCALPNATAQCARGACAVGACAAGYQDCDRSPANGCEASLATDAMNCGACGNRCAAGQVCASGVCTVDCAGAGLTRCDTVCARLADDPLHCGACGNRCPAGPQSRAVCARGTCGLSCAAGYGDCDGNASNGCETATGSDLAHCGACGAACARANATPVCRSGVCQIGACASAWGDCDGDASNGCEASLSSTSDCGACGNVCAVGRNASATCRSGVCGQRCLSGYADCNNWAGDGCEASLTSLTYCGACGTRCARANATATCATGACQILRCASGWGNCDGNDANGCEASLTVNGRCGACGVTCPSGQACAGGACAVAPVEIDVGYQGACARMSDGTARCWGDNAPGAVGDGTTMTRVRPVPVTNLGGTVTNVSTMYGHACARVVLPGGTPSVRCWGHNADHQLGFTSGWTCTVGTYNFNCSPTPGTVSTSTSIARVVAGFGNTCIHLVDNTLRCWGANDQGQLGDGTTTARSTPPSTMVPSIMGVTEVSMARNYGCARVGTSTVYCWGGSFPRTPAVVSGLSNVAQVASGYYHTCARLNDGTVRCWGNNSYGQLGDGTSTSSLTTPVTVPGLTNVVQIAAGEVHTCARLGDGTLRCWGANSSGQLGDGTYTLRRSPVAVVGIDNATQIAAGGLTCALLADATARCWGANTVGGVGDGTTTTRPLPTRVAF